jgi:hypothetical protein
MESDFFDNRTARAVAVAVAVICLIALALALTDPGPGPRPSHAPPAVRPTQTLPAPPGENV